MKTKQYFLLILFLLSIYLVSAMPDPSAVFCSEQGYELKIVNNSIGYCVFPDGSSCEEWQFYGRKCGVEYIKNVSFPCANAGEYKSTMSQGCCSGLKLIQPGDKRPISSNPDCLKSVHL